MTEPMGLIRTFLSQECANSPQSHPLKEFVLDFGNPFLNERPGRHTGLARPNDCFANALQVYLGDRQNLVYVEGFASMRDPGNPPSPILIFYHAWVADRDGRVTDSTWPYDPGRLYYGVPLCNEIVSRTLLRTGCSGVLCEGGEVFNVDLLQLPPARWLHHGSPLWARRPNPLPLQQLWKPSGFGKGESRLEPASDTSGGARRKKPAQSEASTGKAKGAARQKP